MTEAENYDIVKNVKDIFDKMTEYSEGAQSDLFLSFYDNSPTFFILVMMAKLTANSYYGIQIAKFELNINYDSHRIISTSFNCRHLRRSRTITGWL